MFLLLYDNSSLLYCNDHFGHYADFGILPLQIAYYKASNSKSCFEELGRSFTTSQRVEEFTKRFVYEHSEFFGPEEVMFFSKFRNNRGCHALSDDIIESDRQILQHEIENPTHILDSHARYILKALDFWVLHSNEKLLEWGTSLRNVFHEWEIRTKAFEYISEDDEEYTS